jgi:hypothetical protein
MNADAHRDEAVIVSAEICAGHDGAAGLLLNVRYQNGVVGPVVLDPDAGFKLMRACRVADIANLAGQSWRKVLEDN